MYHGRVINLFAGPGVGKSTTCAALFAELKYCNYNVEMITEYAKDAVWEKRGPKVLEAQEYVFGKQSFRQSRVASEVDFVVTDSPLLLSVIYAKDDYLKNLSALVLEKFNQFENLNIFLKRNKPYNPKGRIQNEEEAKEMDRKILALLNEMEIPFYELVFSRDNPDKIIGFMKELEWI